MTGAMIDLVRLPPRSGFSGRRIGIIALAIAGMGVVMIWRLVSLQVLEPEAYVEHGENQRIRTAELAAERGAIVDRNGVELVVSSPRQSIWADPRLVDFGAESETAAQIAALTGADPGQLTRRLTADGEVKFAWMARQLDDETAAEVLALGLPGIYSIEEQARLTPSGGNVARGILGSTDIDGNGVSGLESQYHETLTGDSGRIVVERGLAGVTIPDGRYELVSPEAGDSLVLTLDRTVQFEVEKLLEQTVAESGAKSGTVIVSKTATGEILAMSTVARGNDGIIQVSGENKAVTWIVEPGSISKPIAIGALLEEDLISADTTVEVTDELALYDVQFADEVRHDQDTMTTGQVLANSSNVGVALLIDRITDEKFYDYMVDFGIGSPTALDFPGESAGILHDLDDWSGVSKPFAGIGYGYGNTAANASGVQRFCQRRSARRTPCRGPSSQLRRRVRDQEPSRWTPGRIVRNRS